MRRSISAAFLLALLLCSPVLADHWVKPHTRKDGVRVKGHWRKSKGRRSQNRNARKERVLVHGHYRVDGTWVPTHVRTPGDGLDENNLSYTGAGAEFDIIQDERPKVVDGVYWGEARGHRVKVKVVGGVEVLRQEFQRGVPDLKHPAGPPATYRMNDESPRVVIPGAMPVESGPSELGDSGRILKRPPIADFRRSVPFEACVGEHQRMTMRMGRRQFTPITLAEIQVRASEGKIRCQPGRHIR